MALTFLVKLSFIFLSALLSKLFLFDRLRPRLLDALVGGAGDSGKGVWSIKDMAKWMCSLMTESEKCLSTTWSTCNA